MDGLKIRGRLFEVVIRDDPLGFARVFETGDCIELDIDVICAAGFGLFKKCDAFGLVAFEFAHLSPWSVGANDGSRCGFDEFCNFRPADAVETDLE